MPEEQFSFFGLKQRANPQVPVDIADPPNCVLLDLPVF
jgi:hypothetical protein